MVGRLGIGNGIGIPFRNKVSGGGQSLPPELKEALVGVWIADQNTNESPNRNIIKNKIANAGGDFEILNAAYKRNSGYGLFTDTWLFKDWIPFSNQIVREVINNTTIKFVKVNIASVDNFFCRTNSRQKQQYKITGLKEGQSVVFGYTNDIIYTATTNGIHEVDWSKTTNTGYQELGFTFKGDCDITIEQIPYYQGAFCTDGVDDLIVSQKPVSEMLGGSNEITVVSMIHQIELNSTNSKGFTNYIENIDSITSYVRTQPNVAGKTGIYGYTYNNATQLLINNILGDKNDYEKSLANATNILSNSKFSVAGGINNTNTFSSVAWFWTLIAKRVLTTDEINQVIAYYNLDKYVTPDVYYDVKKQGLTNDNHADFGDKLIDYSGNGKDMQLYNFGWKLDSGVGKYEEDFTSWVASRGDLSLYPYKLTVINATNPASNNYIIWRSAGATVSVPSFTVKITGIKPNINLNYVSVKNGLVVRTPIYSDGIYNLPDSEASGAIGFNVKNGKDPNLIGLTIEQLPSFEGALVFDGVDDYGQYVGDLGLKDYTVVADRAYVELKSSQVPIISNDKINAGNTPFILEYGVDPKKASNPYSYGLTNTVNKPVDIDRKISYQSTYVYNGNTISKGVSTNTGDGLTFGRYGGNSQYAKLCLYNFMLFPYSLSEFLIERQLKKRELGSLIDLRNVFILDTRYDDFIPNHKNIVYLYPHKVVINKLIFEEHGYSSVIDKKDGIEGMPFYKVKITGLGNDENKAPCTLQIGHVKEVYVDGVYDIYGANVSFISASGYGKIHADYGNSYSDDLNIVLEYLL